MGLLLTSGLGRTLLLVGRGSGQRRDTGRRREARGAAGCCGARLRQPVPSRHETPASSWSASSGRWDQNMPPPRLGWLRPSAPSPPSEATHGLGKTLHLPFSGCGFVKRPRRSDPRNAERAVVQMIQKSLMIQCEKGRSKDRRREVNSVPKMALTRQMQGEKSTVDLADIQAQRKKRCMAKSQAFLQSWTRDPAFLRSGRLSGSQPSAGPIGLPRKLGT